MKKIFKIIIVALITTQIMGASSCNILMAPMGKTDTDQALLYEAKLLIDQHDYRTAQSKIRAMTTAFFAQREIQVLYASTYAGLCGLDVISLALSVSGLSGTLFKALLSVFRYADATTYGYCKTAETLLAAIVDNNTPTVDEDFLMIFISLAKIGNLLGYLADTDHDGVPDAGWDKCNAATISDLQVGEIGVSITRILDSLGNAGATLSGLPNASITSLCNTIDTLLGGGSTMCARTDPTAYSAAELDGLRGLISANEVGLVTCGAATPTTVNCLPSLPQCP